MIHNILLLNVWNANRLSYLKAVYRLRIITVLAVIITVIRYTQTRIVNKKNGKNILNRVAEYLNRNICFRIHISSVACQAIETFPCVTQ